MRMLWPDESSRWNKASWFLVVLAGLLVVFGFSTFIFFEELQKLFLHLSPDRSFMSVSVLVLRSSLLSLGLTGACLLLFLLGRRNLLKDALTGLETVNEARFLLVFLCLGLAIRLLWITLVPTQLYSDWKWYDDMAYHMSQVWRYEDNGLATAYWPIGYPFFLAVIYWTFGHSYFAVEMVNVILSLGICLFGYLIARRLAGPVPARLTLVILAFFPSQVFFTNVLASEILFTFLLVLVIHISLKTQNRTSIYVPAVVGFLLGCLTLVRAVALLLPVGIILFYVKSKRKPRLILRDLIIVVAVTFLTLVPWLLRNKKTFGVFTLATSGGVNLYIGNNPHSSGGWVWHKDNPFGDFIGTNEVENDKLGYRLATEYIARDPVGFLVRGVKKEVFFFATDYSAMAKELDLAAQSNRVDRFVVFNIVGQVYYFLILIFAVGGLILFLKRRREAEPGFYLLLGILVYWIGAHFVFFGVDRFHFPLVPILSIFASVCLVNLIGSPSLLNPGDESENLRITSAV
jgi:4-amino-4-deoxy-L-arabinose transferase-like glycosyltransferase